MKACIISIFMDNIAPETVTLQRAVVSKRNPSNYKHIGLKSTVSHAQAIDWFWNENDTNPDLNFDLVMFLDIDAIPLSPSTFDIFFGMAVAGDLVGDVQRSNHIENYQHMFVAPSAVALSRETYNKLGRPSAEPTTRGDVLEEYTWKAEEKGIPYRFLFPISHRRPVVRMPWETDRSSTWKLANGYPEYGVGTMFGIEDGTVPLIYHNFQIFHADHQEFFQKICVEELKKKD